MLRLAIVAVLALTACDRAETPQTAAARQQLVDATASCVRLFQRQRTCTQDFIPALVDLRRSLDRPAGIAQGDRQETIAAALEEWKSDSTDEAIGTTCDRMAPSLPSATVATSDRCNVLP